MSHKELVTLQSSFEGIAKLVGYELWWSVPSCTITRTKYLQYARDFSIPRSYLKDKLSLSEGLTRCTDSSVEAKLKREHSIEFKRLASKKLGTNRVGKAILYSVQNGRKINLYQIGTVTGSTKGVSLHFDATYQHEDVLGRSQIDSLLEIAKKTIEPNFNLDSHDRDDIVRILIQFTREHGVSLRDSGGIYFIPRQQQNLLRQVEKFILACQPDAQVYIKPEYTMSEADLKVYQAVSRSAIAQEVIALEETYRELKSEMEGYKRSRESIQKRTQNKFFNALKDYNLARDRIAAFSKSLEMNTSDLSQKVFGMHKDLEGLLGELRIRVSEELKAQAPKTVEVSTEKWQIPSPVEKAPSPSPQEPPQEKPKSPPPAWLLEALNQDTNASTETDLSIEDLLSEV